VGQRLQNSYLIPFHTKKITMTKTKTIAMLLLIAIATIGAIGIAMGTGMQSAQARFGDPDDSHGQSFHDANGDLHSNGHA
jgi:hypothetical protein